MERRLILSILSFSLLALVQSATGDDRSIRFDPYETSIQWVLDATGHEVEGSFDLIAGNVSFDPDTGTASGRIEIDVASAKTGNDSRDRKMHEMVLESAKYPTFVFEPSRFEGRLAEGSTRRIRMYGDLEIHGGRRPFVIPADVELEGSRMTVESIFSIPFVEWGMKDPSFLFLRVAKEVEVHVRAEVSLISPEGPDN